MKINWMEHKAAESVLRKLGIPFTYHTVKMSEIDVKASRINRARPVPLNLETVEDYAKAQSDGDTFPTIVLVTGVSKKNKYVIAGGNHRHAAAEQNGAREIYAIVAECDEMAFDMLCKALNGVEGLRPDRRLRVRQAVDLMFRNSLSAKEAASIMSVSESAVASVYRSEKARDAASEVGVKLNGSTPLGSLEVLYRYHTDVNVLKPMAELLASDSMTVQDAKELGRVLDKQRSEADRVSVIADHRNRIKPETKKRHRTVLSELYTTLTRMERLVEKYPTARQLQVTSENHQEVLGRWESLNNAMREILTNGSLSQDSGSQKTAQ